MVFAALTFKCRFKKNTGIKRPGPSIVSGDSLSKSRVSGVGSPQLLRSAILLLLHANLGGFAQIVSPCCRIIRMSRHPFRFRKGFMDIHGLVSEVISHKSPNNEWFRFESCKRFSSNVSSSPDAEHMRACPRDAWRSFKSSFTIRQHFSILTCFFHLPT